MDTRQLVQSLQVKTRELEVRIENLESGAATSTATVVGSDAAHAG